VGERAPPVVGAVISQWVYDALRRCPSDGRMDVSGEAADGDGAGRILPCGWGSRSWFCMLA